MSNLPWFMDLTFHVPVQYCSLQHQMYFHHQEHPQPNIISILAQPLLSFWSILGTYWAHLLVSYVFAFSYCPWESQGKNTGVVCHFLLQWTTFCQNSAVWPICLQWPCKAWLIASLSYTRLWSMWSFWLAFGHCGFHSGVCGIVILASSVCLLMDEDKRLVQASWWEGLAVGKTGSCSGGQDRA